MKINCISLLPDKTWLGLEGLMMYNRLYPSQINGTAYQ